MSRIAFVILMLVAVISLEVKLHSSPHWVNVTLYPEDVNYLQISGATFEPSGHGVRLKMDAAGVACLHNIRDCQALRVKVAIENLEHETTRLQYVHQKVVRSAQHFAAVDSPCEEEMDPGMTFQEKLLEHSRFIQGQAAVDAAVAEVGTKLLIQIDRILTRYEVECERDWFRPSNP